MNFKFFINEIKETDLEGLDLKRDLLFGNIFGDKLRVLVPMPSENLELNSLIEVLKEYYEIDYEDLINKKVIYKQVKTQNGIKKRAEKVGKALQNLIDLTEKPKYKELLDWWQKNSSNLKNLIKDSSSSIIVSRSPIDLVRMSDHDNISSCHSPDGSFFKCAKQEARTGGAVAFVVKNSDLKGVDIQKTELFKDKDRKVDGIVPLERLRLRRFTDGKTDILVPEIRTYGTKNIGFQKVVKDWSLEKQKDIIEKIDKEKDFKWFDLKGGSYQDNDAGAVWSNFFDKQVSGTKQSLDADDEEGDGEDLYDAAERQIEEHKVDWTHFSVHHDIYDENTLDYNAYCGFSIPIKLFNLELSNNGFTDRKKYDNYINVKRAIEDSIDIYSINDINLDVQKDSYYFSLSIYDESSLMRGDNQLTRLEHFLDYIDEIDRDFEEHISKVYKALIEKGYIKTITEKISFKNFELEEDDDGTTIRSNPEKIGYLKDFPVLDESAGGFYQDKYIYRDKGKIYINKLRNKFVTTGDFDRLKIFPFIQRASEVKLYLEEGTTSIVKTEELVSSAAKTYKIIRITGWVYFEFEKTLGFDLASNTKSIQLLKNIDGNWDFYIKRLAKFFDSLVKTETNGYGWTRSEAPNFPFNNKKDFYPNKPIFKKPEYIQKTLKFKEHILNEMPIKGFSLLGQWGPESKRMYGYNKQDTGILENPKAVAKIHRSWSNTKFDFDFYFLRNYKSSKHREVGQVSLDWVKENLEINITPKEDHITVIFTNNQGDEKIAMTSWTLAHRLGHAIRKEKMFEEYFRKQVEKDFKEILNYVYGINLKDAYKIRDTYFYGQNRPDYEKYIKSIYLAVGKMKSARDNILRNSNEFIYELVAQYIVTGGIQFNDLPRSLIVERRMAWGKPNHKYKNIIDEDMYQEYNQQLHNNASVYEHYLDSVFGSLVNKIFVM